MSPRNDDPIPPPVHPALRATEQLLRECEFVQTRRSGPGGQHRNKVATAIVLRHLPSGIVGEASERRSQSDNRQVAIRRLREALAVGLRSDQLASPQVTGPDPHEAALRARYHASDFRLAVTNADRPAVLALLLDDLARHEGVPREVADAWGTSPSQIVRFLKTQPEAFAWLNQLRRRSGMRPLK